MIELLVVISIIALLVAILLPSLGSARRQARAAVCGSQMKGLGIGLIEYTTDYNEWFPGVNTTGVAIRAFATSAFGQPDLLRNHALPVQSWDWITPIIQQESDLPRNRAKRMKVATDYYKCPSQLGVETALFPINLNPAQVPDREDFMVETDWTALSYLMPASFQYWGTKDTLNGNLVLSPGYGPMGMPVRALSPPGFFEYQLESYTSRIGRVGTAQRKIMFADGTRYLTENNILDHDVSFNPGHFGSFTSAGGWWSGSVDYGVKTGSLNWDDVPVETGSLSEGKNLRLTYRHGRLANQGGGDVHQNPGLINAMFFDGHIERLTDEQSRKVDYWHPKGAKIVKPQEGLTVPLEDPYYVR